MTKDITRESLISALSHCSLRELPPKDNGEGIWIRAIAKVVKSNGHDSYALFYREEMGQERMVKDFGGITSIWKVEEYYPFEFLLDSYLPKFKTNKKEEKVAFLSKYDKNTNYSSFNVKQLDEAIINIAIKTQLQKG